MAAEEKRRRALAAESRKRPSSTVAEPTDNKRIRLESEAPAPMTATSAAFLANFDFTSLPAPLITNLIVANLEAFTEAQLVALVNAYRQSRGPTTLPTPRPPTAPEIVSSTISKAATAAAIPSVTAKDLFSAGETTTPPPAAAAAEPAVKTEPVDPLQMDIDEEEIEYEPEKLNEAVCAILLLQNSSDSTFFVVACSRGGGHRSRPYS